MKVRRLFLASDHAGIDLKNSVLQILKQNYNQQVIDLGTYKKQSCHYPDFAQKMSKQIKQDDRGILICGSGIGIAIAAVKSGLKASTAYNQYTAKECSKYCQVMAVGQRVVTVQIMKQMIVQFLGPHTKIANYKNYYYFSGGGGGRTGIPNQILIYHGIDSIKMSKKPNHSIQTGSKITENMIIHELRKLLICSQNQTVIIYTIQQNGKSLKKLTEFQSDYSPKNATINALSISGNGSLLAAGGDDLIVKFYNIKNLDNIQSYYQYQGHIDPIRNINNNQRQLFLSSDKYQIIISNLRLKSIIRTIHCDQLEPSQNLIQSAYFQYPQTKNIFIVHYQPRKKTFLSKQDENDTDRLQAMAISNDQCCQTSYNSNKNILGISCGNGTTYMINPINFKKLGHQKKHNYIITGNTIQNNYGAYITGTPQCSFHIQYKNSGLMVFAFSVLITFLVIFLTSLSFEGQL